MKLTNFQDAIIALLIHFGHPGFAKSSSLFALFLSVQFWVQNVHLGRSLLELAESVEILQDRAIDLCEAKLGVSKLFVFRKELE